MTEPKDRLPLRLVLLGDGSLRSAWFSVRSLWLQVRARLPIPQPVPVPRHRRSPLRFELLEDRTLRSADAFNALLSNAAFAAASDLGVAPGIHLSQLTLDPGQHAWYRFELLRPDDVDVKLGFPQQSGELNLQLIDGAGNVLGVGALSDDGVSLTASGLAAGTYFVHASTAGFDGGVYSLDIDPAASSATTVYYVNDASTAGDVYTRGAGDNANTGLTPDDPVADVQTLLDTYVIGSHDLIVIDTGIYTVPVDLTLEDQGAAYAGVPGVTRFSNLGIGITVSGADDNTFYGLGFTGFSGIGLSLRSFADDPASNNIVRNNTFTGLATAVRIQVGTGNVIENNTFDGTGTHGINLIDGASVLVRNNAISGRTHAIHATNANLVLQDNDLSGGAYGVYFESGALQAAGNRVTGFTAAGILGQSGLVTIAGNTIHDNGTGIEGVGQLGGSDWNSFNDIFGNEVGVRPYAGAVVAFNRIHDNAIGIDTTVGLSVHHNVLFRNGVGIRVNGGDGAAITSNTIYTAAGDGIRLESGAANVRLRNNIIWTEDGYDVYVADDSQAGFASDYNNLFTSGDGKLAFWQKDFTDLYDWQGEANFDHHSIGYTELSPALDNPLFVNLGHDDYHLTDLVSTSLDAGDAASVYSLEPGVNGARIDLGAYGNTTEASQSSDAYIRIDAPNYYTDWNADAAHTIVWHTYDAASKDLQLAGKVTIDLYRDGGKAVATISTVPATAGSVQWTPATSGIIGDSAKRYRIQITSVNDATLSDSSREAFAIPGSGTSYYVNDAIAFNGQYTVATGNNRNTGKTPADPKANLLAILASYDLKRGDTIYIDTGYYLEVRNVIISGTLGNDSGVTITGPTAVNKVATLDRGNTSDGAAAIEVDDGDQVSIKNLTLTGGDVGLWVHNNSAGFMASRVTATSNNSAGFKVESDSPFSISDSTASSNFFGFYLTGTGGGRLEGNLAFANDTSISATNTGSTPTIIGNADLKKGKGNKIYNNATAGINATGNVQVLGNTVFGQSGIGQTGILMNSASAQALIRNNVVYNNYDGISVLWAGVVDSNRVYQNNRYGIRAAGAVVVRNNVVYSNDVGVYATGAGGLAGVIANNLIYANTTAGLVIADAAGAWTVNNTIYQPLGDAVRLQDGSQKVTLRNNILWAQEGYDLSVDADSEEGLASDFNDLYTSGAGKVGIWGGIVRPTLLSWKSASGQDRSSFALDPLFNDLDGGDGALGFADFSSDGRDDDFHEQSVYGSYHCGALAPVVNAATGLPVMPVGTWVVSQAQSPVIDRGLVSSVGRAVNVGAYGNTAQESRSAPEPATPSSNQQVSVTR